MQLIFVAQWPGLVCPIVSLWLLAIVKSYLPVLPMIQNLYSKNGTQPSKNSPDIPLLLDNLSHTRPIHLGEANSIFKHISYIKQIKFVIRLI